MHYLLHIGLKSLGKTLILSLEWKWIVKKKREEIN